MIILKKTYWASGVVCCAIGLMFAVPCIAQEAPSELSPKESFEKKLSVRIKQTRLKSKEIEKLGFEDDDDKIEIDYDGFVCTLEFRNGSEFAFDDLKVECRYFYTEESSWRNEYGAITRVKSDQKYQEDSFDMNLQPKGRYKNETRPFVIQSYRLNSGYRFGDMADKIDADPIGVWVRIFYTAPDGEKLQRDICEPKSFSDRISWDGKSI